MSISTFRFLYHQVWIKVLVTCMSDSMSVVTFKEFKKEDLVQIKSAKISTLYIFSRTDLGAKLRSTQCSLHEFQYIYIYICICRQLLKQGKTSKIALDWCASQSIYLVKEGQAKQVRKLYSTLTDSFIPFILKENL